MVRIPPAILAATLGSLLAAGSATAQHGPQPYAEQEKRAVKALSDTEIADLLAGRGMGLAKAAELNGYPGPAHLLEHAAVLKLSDTQRAAIEAIRARMAAAATVLGRDILEHERALEAAFADARIDAALLKAKTDAIAALMGRLRAVHLVAHIESRPLLRPEQIADYDKLRGYAGQGEQQQHQPKQQH